MRVIGVDPGSAATGFGVVESSGGRLCQIVAGTIRTNPRIGIARRLQTIYDRLSEVIAEHSPDALSLEKSFVGDNVQSAFRLGEARAMALLAAAHNNIPFFEYAPAQVKLTVAAYGRADKRQVKFMVRRALELDESAELSDDASDALAVALCHLAVARLTGVASAASARRWPRKRAAAGR